MTIAFVSALLVAVIGIQFHPFSFLLVFLIIEVPAILLVYSAQKSVTDYLQSKFPNEWAFLDGWKNNKGWKPLRDFYRTDECFGDESLLSRKKNYQKMDSFGKPMVLLGPFIAGLLVFIAGAIRSTLTNG